MKELIRLLSDEIKRNNQNISISEDRMITVLNNGLTGKVLYKFLLSIIPYFVLLALVVVLARMGILSSLVSVVSPTFLNIGIVAGSFGIGSLLHSIMVKRNYTKEELRVFTSANKLDELTLEEVNLKIEQQKGKNRNIVIEEVLSFLKSNSNMQTNSNYYFSNELKRIAVRKFLDGLKKI